MRHLTPDELLDYVEQSPDAGAHREHVETCAECRAEVASLAAILSATRQVEVPEPSPLFWDQFSGRVRQAIAADSVGAEPSATRWLRWPALVPLSGLALVILALASGVALRDGSLNPPAIDIAVGESATPDEAPATLDTTWALVADLVGPLDLETAEQAGIALRPGAADEAVLGLSADEHDELLRLLRAELGQPGG